MSRWTKLPLEILTIIFNDYIESSKHLAKCRLVCQSWNHTAEIAMLRKQLDLEEIDETKFYNYISKKPELAKHIKDVSPAGECIDEPCPEEGSNTSVKLWSIIFTEGLKSITGSIEDPEVFDKVCTILEESPLKFGALTKVKGFFPYGDVYMDLVYLLADNLKHTTLSEASIHLLGECKRLETLDLNLDFDGSLQAWEDMLQDCPNLTAINIHFRRAAEFDRRSESLTKEKVQS